MSILTRVMKIPKKCLKYSRRHNILTVCVTVCLVTTFYVYIFTHIPEHIFDYLDQGSEDNVRLYRDLFTQDPWPQLQLMNTSFPGEIPFIAHYFWCGKKDDVFRFEDYLGILSVVRILKPQKIIFHYNHRPSIDRFWYHTWFQELKQSVPNFVMRMTYSTGGLVQCETREILEFGLRQISEIGGVFIGEKTIITRIPNKIMTSDFYVSFGELDNNNNNTDKNDGDVSMTHGVFYSKGGFPISTIESKLEGIIQTNQENRENRCPSLKTFAANGLSLLDTECIWIKDSFVPKDIWDLPTEFGELCRWLFYGTRRLLEVKPDPEGSPLIPMTSHIVWIRTDNVLKTNEFQFLHYLSVLSALYLAGLEHVYIHGEVCPYGEWWDSLIARNENVTFVQIERPETIFQQRVDGPSHQSDILRLSTLLNYGGVYQDRDVLWVNPIPRDVRRYQTVLCPDWPIYGEWPESFNLGVMMAKPGASWLKHFLKTFSYYRDDKWAFNAMLMSYKAYEFHPDTLYIDRYLQVICFRDNCHPTWYKDYKANMDDETPSRHFDWRDARAFHFTVPKPPPTLTSPKAIREGSDVYAKIGKLILEKSGRIGLLRES